MTARAESREWTTGVCSVKGCDETAEHGGDHVQIIGSLTIRGAAGGWPCLLLVTREGPTYDTFETRIHITTPRGESFALTPSAAQVETLRVLLVKAASGEAPR